MKKNKKGIKKRNSSKLPQSSVNIDSEGEKLRGIAENKSMEIRQVELDEVCDVCGHIGFDIALMYCSMCSDTAVHQYCLGIPPGSIDDTYHWLCEYCSPSMESGHQKSSFEESLKDPRLSFELETEQDENMILMVEEDVEPLCILPPLVHRENCEHQCRNTYSTSNSHLLNSKEKHDPYSGNGSLHQIGEDISWNGPISLYQPFNDSLDRVESEASVSSLMECPKEIISGLVLLVSLSGDIVIQGDLSFCSCLAPSIGNMANSCNGMNSKKSANDLSFKMKPHLASYVDEPVGIFGEVAYECVNQEIVELAGCSHGTDHDVDAVDTCQKNGGEDADSCGIKRKRESTQVNFDLLQPLGPQCKRIRSKRYKISSSWNKEAGAPLAVDIPSIGKEGSSKVVMLRNTCHGIGQAETSINIDSLTRDGLQVEGIYKNCGLYSGMVDTCCGNNAKERCAQVDDGLCDQGVVAQKTFCNACPSQDLTIACRHQNAKDFFCPNNGIGANEVVARNSSISSPRCAQDYPYMENCMRNSHLKYDVEIFKQVMDVEDMFNENILRVEEASYSTNSRSSLQGLNMERQPCTDLSSQKPYFSTKALYDDYAIMEKEMEDMQEASDNVKKLKESIIYPNSLMEYDVEFQKLKTSHDNLKKNLNEVVKTNRRRLWKVVYELETIKKVLQEKMVELAKKTVEAEMAKELGLKKDEAFVQNKKKAYDIWLAGYSSAESVIYQLHPELNWDSIKAVSTLLFLRNQ